MPVRYSNNIHIRVRNVLIAILLGIQSHFYSVIRGQAADFLGQHHVTLPELAPLNEFYAFKMV